MYKYRWGVAINSSTACSPHQQSFSLPKSPSSLLVIISDCSRKPLPRRRLLFRQLLLYTRQDSKTINVACSNLHSEAKHSLPETSAQLRSRQHGNASRMSVGKNGQKQIKSRHARTWCPVDNLNSLRPPSQEVCLFNDNAVPSELFNYLCATSAVRGIHPRPRPLTSLLAYRGLLVADATSTGLDNIAALTQQNPTLAIYRSVPQ